MTGFRDEVLSTAGVYRMILVNEGLDRRDVMPAESFMDEIVTVLDDELSDD